MHLHRGGFLTALALLAGCGIYESLGATPNAKRQFKVPTHVNVGHVFACAEKSIHAIPEPSNWNKTTARKDLDAGVMEVGNFDEPNLIGLRAIFCVKKGSITVEVKAAGPYATDLGADRSADRLIGDMKQCLGGE